MAIAINIPSALRRFTDGLATVRVEASTAGEALSALVGQFPELRKHLYGDDGSLRSFVNVFVNDEDIRHREKADTPVRDGDELHIIPSIAGGSSVADAPREGLTLTNEEIQRYSRHLILPEVGVEGQKKLKAGRVLMVGAGGLGSPLGLYLAAAGIGRIGIVDFDVVDHSNLQRQLLHGTKDVGRLKLDSARDRLADINPNVEVDGYEVALSSANAFDILRDYDVVVDGTDNFPTRYLVNDACVLLGKPNVYGSIFRFEGQASVFDASRGPCYRCLYPEPPPPGLVPSCAEGGVLGVLPGIVGAIQAIETIKIILGQGESLVGRLLLFDALALRFRELKLRKNPECPLCGQNPTITELIDYHQFCGVPNGPSAEELELERQRGADWEITPVELKAALDAGARPYVLDVREPHEAEICQIPGTDRLIPHGSIDTHVDELDRDREIVVYCKGGVRSAKAFDALRRAGFTRLKNLRGGILGWAREVDPSMPQY